MHPWGHAQAGRNEESHTNITKGEVGGCENLWLEVMETFKRIRKKMEGTKLLGGYYILRKTFQGWEIHDMVCCATIYRGRYTSHSGKIHYIQEGDLCLYICGTTFG